MKAEARFFVRLLVVDILILAAAIFAPSYLPIDPRRALSFGTTSIGILAFLGFFHIGYGPGLLIERAMRNAIAGSVVVMYLTTVGMVTFFGLVEDKQELNPLTKAMIDSFQSIITVVIGFYFASSAIVEGIQRSKTGGVSVDPPNQGSTSN